MRCREYYIEQALINMRRGYTENGVNIVKFPCAGIVELEHNRCPECGWRAEYDLEGNLLPQFVYRYNRSANDECEHELVRIRRENRNTMRRREMKEKINKVEESYIAPIL